MEPFHVEDRGDERWISLRGELDQTEILDLKSVFDAAVGSADGNVVVDLGGVDFIGTVGVGLLISTREDLQRKGRTLKLATVPPAIEKTLKMMALWDTFERV